jgi:Site-specific recombinase XerD
MWSEIQKNGKVKFCERYKAPMTLELKKVSVTLEKDNNTTRKIAMGILNKKIDIAMQITHTNLSTLTLEQLAEKYQAYQEKVVKPSTLARNKYAINTLMAILGKNILVANLTASYIKDRLLATNESPSRLNERIRRLKAWFNWAFENDWVENVSYLKKIKPFPTHKILNVAERFLEQQELKDLLSGMKSCIHWYYVARFMSLSGLRVGEVIALKNSDIDIDDEMYIRVSKTYNPNLHYVSDSPKTDCSNRDVFVQPELAECIKEMRIYVLTQKLQHGYRNEKNIFFPGTTGGYFRYEAFNKYLKQKSLEIIGREITTHILRHTHASLLLPQNVDIETITRRLGHKNSKVTREVYLHVTKGLKEKDNAQIKNTRII